MGGSELPRLLDITGAHQCQAVACCLPQQLPPQEGAASAAAVLGWGVRAPLGPFPCGCKALENLSESLHRDPSPVQGFASRCGHGTCPHVWGQVFSDSPDCRFTRDSLATQGDGALRTRRELNAALDLLLCLVSFLLGTQPIWGIFFQCLMPLTDSAWQVWERQDGAYWGGDL